MKSLRVTHREQLLILSIGLFFFFFLNIKVGTFGYETFRSRSPTKFTEIHYRSQNVTIGKLELLLVSLGSWSSSILVSYVPVFGTPQSGIWGRVRTRHCESEPLVGIVTHFKGSFSSLVKWEGDTLGLLTSSPLLGSYYSIKFGQDQTKLLKNEEADGNLLIIG